MIQGQTALALPGAIWTTDINGVVNQNHYDSKQDVYLNGGPQTSNAPGLPDGLYHVKITEPNGTLLGTSSGGPPPIQVTGGQVTGGPGPNGSYKVWDIVKKASDNSTGYDDTSNPGGVYKAWLSKDPDFANSASKTDNFKALSDDGGIIIVIPPPDNLEVKKFYDANANGMLDMGEQLLENWKISIDDGMTAVDRFTTLLEAFPPGNYAVTEYLPVQPNWFATTPVTVNVVLAPNILERVTFGNLCLGPGGGKTLGFWSNKNGQNLMNDGGSMVSELALLTEKNLRSASGAHFNPPNYAGFRSWLLGANATNMAYMLSAQFAAMTLNVEANLVNASAIIYAPGTNSANALGYAVLQDVLDEADALLGANGLILAGNPVRTLAEALKNALDMANNNLNFVQPEPCPYSFELLSP